MSKELDKNANQIKTINQTLNPHQSSLITAENNPTRVYKDLFTLNMAFGDGIKEKSQNVTLVEHRAIEQLLALTHDLESKNIAADTLYMTVGDFMRRVRETHIERVPQILENLQSRTIRLDCFGTAAKIYGEFFKNRARRQGLISEEFLKSDIDMLVTTSELLAFTRMSHSDSDLDEKEEPDFELVDNSVPEVYQPDNIYRTWKKSDLVAISWGTAIRQVKELNLEALKISYILKDKAKLKNKYAYPIYDICFAEAYKREETLVSGGPGFYTEWINAVQFHSLIMSRAETEALYWRTHPLYNKTKNPWKSLGLVQGGMSFLRKEIKRALKDIQDQIGYEIVFEEMKKRKDSLKASDIRFHIRRPSMNVIDYDQLARERMMAIPGMSAQTASQIAREYQHYQEEILLAIATTLQSEQEKRITGNAVAYFRGTLKRMAEAKDNSVQSKLFNSTVKDSTESTYTQKALSALGHRIEFELLLLLSEEFKKDPTSQELKDIFPDLDGMNMDQMLRKTLIRTRFIAYVKEIMKLKGVTLEFNEKYFE